MHAQTVMYQGGFPWQHSGRLLKIFTANRGRDAVSALHTTVHRNTALVLFKENIQARSFSITFCILDSG